MKATIGLIGIHYFIDILFCIAILSSDDFSNLSFFYCVAILTDQRIFYTLAIYIDLLRLALILIALKNPINLKARARIIYILFSLVLITWIALFIAKEI